MIKILIALIGAILSFIPLLWHPATAHGLKINLVIEVVVWLIMIWELCYMIRRR